MAVIINYYLIVVIYRFLLNDSEILILKVFVNQVPKKEYEVIKRDNDYLFYFEDFEELGFDTSKIKPIKVNDTLFVSINDLSNLISYKIDEENFNIYITVDPSLLKPQILTLRKTKKDKDEITNAQNSAFFLNYGITSLISHGKVNLPYFFGELEINIQGVFLNSIFLLKYLSSNYKFFSKYNRIIIDNVKNLRRIIIGDTYINSLIFGSKDLFCGIKIFSNYFFDPDVSYLPSIDFSLSNELPSTIEIYANDRLIDSFKSLPGIIYLKDLPANVGLINTKIIVKDIFGNEKIYFFEHYLSHQVLKKFS